MDFNLSEEQEALQEMARDFLRERWPIDRSREGLDKRPAVIDDEVWQEIVEMGWLGVMAPEEAGGIGADVMTAAVLAQEAGLDLRRETDAGQWLIPFTFHRLPVLSLHALEFEFPHRPAGGVQYVGPMVLESRNDRPLPDDDRQPPYLTIA